MKERGPVVCREITRAYVDIYNDLAPKYGIREKARYIAQPYHAFVGMEDRSGNITNYINITEAATQARD